MFIDLTGTSHFIFLVIEVQERPVSISFLPKLMKPQKFNVVWSSGGRYLASCTALAPAVIWIWTAGCSFQLYCVVVAKQSIQGIYKPIVLKKANLD